MALSFEDSINENKKNEKTSKTTGSNVTMNTFDINNMIADLSDESNVADFLSESKVVMGSEWFKDDSGKYVYYEDYSDENISTVDVNKNVVVNQNQINITQESNSQYIPFEMPRYYDGFDLSKTTVFIHWVNKNDEGNRFKVVDVYYSSDKIRFAWLVDSNVAAIAGNVRFEIIAEGVNSKGEAYCLKTRPNNQLNVLESLSNDGMVKPDNSWITSFLDSVTAKVAEAQAVVTEVSNLAGEASESADKAKEYADKSQSVVDDAKKYLEGTIDTAVDNKTAAKITEALEDYSNTAQIGITIDNKIKDALLAYYTSAQVDQMFEDFDISDQLEGIQNQIDSLDGLAKFKVEYDGTTMTFKNGEAVMDSIAIPSAEFINSVNSRFDTVNAGIESLQNAVGDLPTTLKSDYYTKNDADGKFATKADVNAVDTKVSGFSAFIDANKQNITTLSNTVKDLSDAVNGIDKSPRLTYDATYDEEQVYTLWEIENEGAGDNEKRTPKSQFKIQGGGGGGTTSTLKIEYVTPTPLVATVDDDVVIKYRFSGTDSSGDEVQEGTATWRVGGTVVATNTAVSGENSFDVTKYLTIGTQKVNLSIIDDAGSLVTKAWTVQKIDVRLESTFNDRFTYPMGSISFDYTPYGAIEKTVHFKLDGKEIGTVTTSVSGVPMAYSIPEQKHGAHLFEVYMTANINNSVIESNHILKDIIWCDPSNTTPVIGCVQQNFIAKQYASTSIEYSVYDPSTETPVVELGVDGKVVSTLTLDSNTQVWQYKSSDVGNHVLTIKCGDTVKTLNVTIEKIDVNIEPVTAGLVFDFDPTGKSNNDADRLFNDGTTSMTVSDNFDWVNGGYHIDENGDQYFGIKAGTRAVISHNLFADDAKRFGKEFKVVFKTENVSDADASFLTCLTQNVGIDMSVHNVSIYTGTDKGMDLPYSEEDVIEFEFNIAKYSDETGAVNTITTYEDGVASRAQAYDENSQLMQLSIGDLKPVPITIGSDNCDVRIYRMKAYSAELTDRGILNNFIADARSAEEMIDRYNRNQIYNENGVLTPESLAEACPWLRVMKLSAPKFTADKKEKISGTTVQMIYKNGDPITDNWTATGCWHSGQGTSSNEYGAAGRNLLINTKGAEITLGDGTPSDSDKVQLTPNSIKVQNLNFKVNIASSENANNALLQARYNKFNPYIRYARKKNPNISDTMEFYNAVIFVQETDPDYANHREFQNTDFNYYALGNIGDSKKNDKVRMDDKDNPLEAILEIQDFNTPLSEFPTLDTEITKPAVYDKNGALKEPEQTLTAEQWLEADKFDESGSYGWRYLQGDVKDAFEGETEGMAPEDIEKNLAYEKQLEKAWKDFYRFVVTSTDEEFHDNLKDYFVVDSALFYYLFTERYTMVDNRAKNSFWRYAPTVYTKVETEELNEDGAKKTKTVGSEYRWDLTQNYDDDTALGISNTGELVMSYGVEDTDKDENGEYWFRAANSTFFRKIARCFSSELATMFTNLESAGAWSSNNLIKTFDDSQSEFPEELWRTDIERKYVRTYKNGATQFLLDMMNGRKKYQRRQFERNQELYMSTKYISPLSKADQIMIRFANPSDLGVTPNADMTITPYSDMYLNVSYSAGNVQQVRLKAGQTTTVRNNTGTQADITLIYAASFIREVSDLSSGYLRYADFSKAKKLQKLILGSGDEGYANPFLPSISFGNNKLLKVLDIQNITGLTATMNLSSCDSLEEVYAKGSSAPGFIFANGGRLRIAELPAIQSLSAKNLNYVTDFDVESYEKLTNLTLEDNKSIDSLTIVSAAITLMIASIIGVDWELDNTDLLKRIYKMAGIDKNGYNTDRAVLAGKVHVPVVKQQELYNYQKAWNDLDITYNTMMEQFAVTFVNDDGTILDIQYVDKGSDAVDPITRDEDPIPVPTKESSVSTDFTYAGWDSALTGIFADRTIKATYTESIRRYTIRYVSRGTTLQESTGLYGENVIYTGDTPVYTLEESAYKFYFFNRWDKSGVIDGDKVVNAVFDSFVYTPSAFQGKQLKDLTPVQVYAVTQLGIDVSGVDIQDGDEYSFDIGYDIDFDDIESSTIIAEKKTFDGSNHVDTGIKLFDEDRDFTLAIDYKMAGESSVNSVLAQCFQSNGSNGFRLWGASSGVKASWGTTSGDVAARGAREMIVIRHIKGENSLTVYNSNLNGNEPQTIKLDRTRNTITDSTLVFGCAKADDGAYENHAIGEVNWCKVWYMDLGDDACKKLAGWTHEHMEFEVCGFKRYYLSDNPSKRCTFTMLATHLMDRYKRFNDANNNNGGWATSRLNTFLNSRLYSAMPTQIKSLMKKVRISSSVGNRSDEISQSDCYIAIPAIIELVGDGSFNNEPYINEGQTISYMVSKDVRKRSRVGGDYASYWTRSPNASYANYIYQIDKDGNAYGFTYPNNDAGVLLEISF